MTKLYGKDGFVEKTVEIEKAFNAKYIVVERDAYGFVIAKSAELPFFEALRTKNEYIEMAKEELNFIA